MLFMSAVGDEISAGLLQRSDPRYHCLAYRRRKTSTDNVTNLEEPNGLNLEASRHEELWQKIQQYLGPSHARQYIVASEPGLSGGLSAEDEVYLRNLSDDFVAGTKELVLQSLEKVQPDSPTKRLFREIRHHTTLARRKLDGSDGARQSGKYAALFQRIQTYIKDPRQSCRPFVVYGGQGCDMAGVMPAVAAVLKDWMSSCGLVTVLRIVGTTTDSVDVQNCVASVRAQVQMSYGLEVSPRCPSLHSELATFRMVADEVSQTCAHSEPLILLLDGVDRLEPQRDALQALWALRRLPANVHLIMSISGGGGQRSGSIGEQVDITEALLALITDRNLTYNISSDNELTQDRQSSSERSDNDGCESGDVGDVEMLISTLETMESDYGPTLIKFFASYVTVMDVGILDSEVFDLLVTNDKVLREWDQQVPFSAGIVSILRQRLSNFLADRLVSGQLAFSWRSAEYRAAVGGRYGVIVGGVNELSDRLADFSLTLHSNVVKLYQLVTQDGFVVGADVSLDSGNQDDVRTTVQKLDSQNPVKASRLLQHLRALMPLEGLDRIKRSVLFNLDWIMTRLATSSAFQLINDVLSIHYLCQIMHQREIITDSVEDIVLLLEFLQSASRAIAVNRNSLPVEVVTRLGAQHLVKKFRSISELVLRCRRWMDDTDSLLVVPLWPVWDHPGQVRTALANLGPPWTGASPHPGRSDACGRRSGRR